MIKLPLKIYFLFIYDPFQKFSGVAQRKRGLEANVNNTPLDSPGEVVFSKMPGRAANWENVAKNVKYSKKLGIFIKFGFD